jgi:hypothetical protein
MDVLCLKVAEFVRPKCRHRSLSSAQQCQELVYVHLGSG